MHQRRRTVTKLVDTLQARYSLRERRYVSLAVWLLTRQDTVDGAGVIYRHRMRSRWGAGGAVLAAAALTVASASCGGHDDLVTQVAVDPAGPPGAGPATTASPAAPPPAARPAPKAAVRRPPPSPPVPAGNPGGGAVPGAAAAADTSHPDRVIGTGTAASCTSDAVVRAVAAGGVITFDCGPAPVTITLAATAKIRNDTGPDIVLDGGGKVTLSGGGRRRILYMNTCDEAQVFTTSHCQDQDTPRLTVQNLTFVDGNATGETTDGGGGGAIFVRGGRFKVVSSRFFRNACDPTGPDLGGAAIRVLSQARGLPVYVVGSTFGGAPGQGGRCSNGGALSSIGVSWEVINSVFTHNEAVGFGANPPSAGNPGGGSGGAIYTDGDRYTVHVVGSRIEDNHAREGGGAIFFVSNDHTGTLSIEGSTLRRNPSDQFETAGFPGIFFIGAGRPHVSGSTLG